MKEVWLSDSNYANVMSRLKFEIRLDVLLIFGAHFKSNPIGFIHWRSQDINTVYSMTFTRLVLKLNGVELKHLEVLYLWCIFVIVSP